ncbi:MAG: bifunctional glutamate N-acetyltransferase/amino-acid acetyltransferase ArgJ [Campylobacterales bacterium]
MFKIFPIEGGVCAPKGFRAGGLVAGLRKEGTPDVAYIYSTALCQVGAVFTTNRFAAAPILHFKKHAITESNFILVNAKNANAMTGQAGIGDVEELLAQLQASYPNLINPVMSSTGVIGVRLPKEKIASVFPSIDLEATNSAAAAQAIMTTDRWPKEIALRVELEDGRSFTVGAIAKGAGMINPAMATMLCFITTDAAVPKGRATQLLQEKVKTTFNAISVDGDTSTNDTVLLYANGLSGAYDDEAFGEAVRLAMHELALSMVKDGEGATKLVAFEVTGAASDEEAEIAAKALSNSNLVKTALYGNDPNWGRIASTIGASQISCDADKLTITFGDVTVYRRGEILFDAATEARAAKVMQQDEFRIICDLGLGEGRFTAYGCDLGYEYVRINADYRT